MKVNYKTIITNNIRIETGLTKYGQDIYNIVRLLDFLELDKLPNIFITNKRNNKLSDIKMTNFHIEIQLSMKPLNYDDLAMQLVHELCKCAFYRKGINDDRINNETEEYLATALTLLMTKKDLGETRFQQVCEVFTNLIKQPEIDTSLKKGYVKGLAVATSSEYTTDKIAEEILEYING